MHKVLLYVVGTQWLYIVRNCTRGVKVTLYSINSNQVEEEVTHCMYYPHTQQNQESTVVLCTFVVSTTFLVHH